MSKKMARAFLARKRELVPGSGGLEAGGNVGRAVLGFVIADSEARLAVVSLYGRRGAAARALLSLPRVAGGGRPRR